MIKRFFKYIENFWLGNDGKPSLRKVLAIAMAIDFIINVHKSVNILYKVVLLYFSNRTMDPVAISSLGSGLANVSLILGIEAALIAAFLALTTYQNFQFNKTESVQVDQPPISQ